MQRLIDVQLLMNGDKLKALNPLDHLEYWYNYPDALLLEKYFINDNGKLRAVRFDPMLHKHSILKDGTVIVENRNKEVLN